MPSTRKLPRAARITRRDEFARVRTKGKSYPGPLFVLGIWKSGLPEPARVGVITTRKTGGAVERNRARRRLRELVRVTRPKLQPGFWLVLVARKPITTCTAPDLKKEWLRLAGKASILIPPQPDTSSPPQAVP